MSDLLKYEKAAKQAWGYFDKFASLLSEKQMSVVRNYNAQTAYIDLKTNTITIPFFATEDKDVFLLMLSHEVSHALHTPTDWYKTHNKEKGTRSDNSTYLRRVCTNIVEDIRIEKLIRRKFPGFVNVYNRGYNKLLGMDFFSINEWDKFKLHDRINAHAKLGKLLPMPLSSSELAVYKYLSSAETFDEVDVRAEYLYQLVKDEIVNDRKFNSDSEAGGCEEDLKNDEDLSDDELHFPRGENEIDNDEGEKDETEDETSSGNSPSSSTENGSNQESKNSSLPEPNETPDSELEDLGEEVKSKTEDVINSSMNEYIDTRTRAEFRPVLTHAPQRLIW